MKELILYHYIDKDQRAHWPSHEVIFFDAKNYKLYKTNSLSKFCEVHGLALNKISTLIAGRSKSHKGLTIWSHGMPTNIQTISL